MIRAHNVTKFYGAKQALGPVSFEIKDGEAVGFLGLNGAGKTTALRIFACDLRPSAGNVTVGDVDAVKHPHEVRKRIGFLPENPPLYVDMTVRDYLVFAGRLRGMTGADLDKRLPKALELADLGQVRGDIIGTLSHGYRQRVGLAQAIIHDPKLLILDEPTRGLDPVQIVEMRALLKNLKQAHTVLISSHILTEISETCDRMLVLGKGQIIASGAEADLSKELAGKSRLLVSVRAKGTGSIPELLGSVLGVTSHKQLPDDDGASVFEISSDDDVRAAVNRKLVEAGHDVIRLTTAARELESIFLKLVEGGSRGRN